MSTYTTIIHGIRKELNLSCNEYVIADTVYHLSKNGKCKAKRGYLAEIIGVTKPGLFKIISSLIEKELVVKNDDDTLSSTDTWINKVYVGDKQSLPNEINKVYGGDKQSLSLYNNIYKEVNNNINNQEEEKESKIPGGDINAVISYFYKAMAPAALGNAIKNKTIRLAAEGLLRTYSIIEIRTIIDKNKAKSEGFGKCYSLTQFTERFEALKNEGPTRSTQNIRNLDNE